MKRYFYSGVGLVALAVLFLAFTVVTQRLLPPLRLDLTETGQFTLSDATKRILAEIDEPIDVYFYYSAQASVRDSYPQLPIYAQQVRDLLREYALRSKGKLVLHEIDPEPFSEAEDRAVAHGVQPIPVGGAKVYFGLSATNSVGQRESIPFFHPQRAATLEYDLSKLLYTLQHPQKPVIGVISRLPLSGQWNPMAGGSIPPWQVYSDASQLFEIRDLSLPLEQRIDPEIKALWVVHPKDLDQKSRYFIDQFIMNGGKALIFVDPFAESEPPPPGMHPLMARGEPRYSDLPELFQAWGLQFDHNKVLLDRALGLLVYSQADGRPIQHAGIVGLNAQSVNHDVVITSQLQSLNLGYSGVLTWKEVPGVKVTPLLTSSPEGRLVDADTVQNSFEPSGLVLPAKSGEGSQRVLAVHVSGELPSAFQAPPEGVENPDHLSKAKAAANVIVVADADLLADEFWLRRQQFLQQTLIQPIADNGDFVINALDNLAGSADLIAIRSRAVYSRPFEKVAVLRAEAEARFRAKEQELQNRLSETERKLEQLKTSEDGSTIVLTADQRQALERFRQEALRIRQELREVRYQLDKDIQALGLTLKWFNIAAMPLLVAVFGIVVALLRARRRRRAKEVRYA